MTVVRPRLMRSRPPAGRAGSTAHPHSRDRPGRPASASCVMRPLSDLFLWAWRLERRAEYLYRPWFDRWLRPPLFAALQAFQNGRRADEHLALAQERELPDEERLIQDTIDELVAFTRENWLPGGAQRFGNTKTFGVLRGELTVLPGLPEHLRHGFLAQPRSFPAWVRFSGPGPYAPPDLEDYGQCSVGIKLMDVPGPKLLDDERATQDLLLVSPASFVTPDIRENAKLQRWVRAKAPLGYAINPGDTHLLHLAMQLLYSPVHANPLEVQYYSNVPFLLGDGTGRAVLAAAGPAHPHPDPAAAGGELPARRDGGARSPRGSGRSTSWCRCRPTRTGCRSRTPP